MSLLESPTQTTAFPPTGLWRESLTSEMGPAVMMINHDRLSPLIQNPLLYKKLLLDPMAEFLTQIQVHLGATAAQ